ncbi:unnamed protein product [Zymoseptoria tritici ST99CH_3D1]|nr:unnamed protein product [Zymoseptoria tritici ST99CH_3D1]
MTAVRSAGVHYFQPPFDQIQMSDHYANDAWRRSYPQQMPLPSNNWHDGSNNMPVMTHGMLETDLRMFQQSEAGTYNTPFTSGQQRISHALVSPRLAFPPDAAWASDMELGTPSTGTFPSNIDEGYTIRHTSNHLTLPSTHGHDPSDTNSPRSSFGDQSPSSQYVQPIFKSAPKRPGIARAVTAPDTIPQRPLHSPPIKRSPSDDGEDDDYFPSASDPKTSSRNRKRARIPHTAVERRYRENLNAHLDRLRQTVPELAARSGVVNGKGGEPAGLKPSKCEILTGAIEHIGALGQENYALKAEAEALRGRLEQLERWMAQR